MTKAEQRAENRIRFDVIEYDPTKGYSSRAVGPNSRSDCFATAKAEAKRLASLNPGVFYEVFQLVGVAHMEPTPTKADWADKATTDPICSNYTEKLDWEESDD